NTSGVTDATVNLMLNSATVDFDSAVTRPESLVDAIRSAGYEASLPRADERLPHAEAEEHDRSEFRELKRKAIVGGVAAAIAMILSIPLIGMAYAVHGQAAD